MMHTGQTGSEGSDFSSFYLLAGNQFFVQLAHAVFDISLMWMVYDITRSNAGTGLIVAIAYLPFLLFGLPAGIFSDRYEKRMIIRSVSFIRIFAALLIPAYAYFHAPGLFYITASAFVLTTVSVFHFPARDSLIPDYLEPSRLVKANSLIQGSVQMAYIIGTAAAGILIDHYRDSRIFLFVSLLFLLGSLLSLGMKSGSAGSRGSEMHRSGRALSEVISHVTGDKRVLWIILITMADNLFIMGPAYVGVFIFVRTVLGGSGTDYALCETSLAAGMVTGSILIMYFGRKIPLGPMLILGMIFDGLTYVPVYFVRDVHILWAVIFIHALFIPMITISRTTLLQELVPRPLQGRIFSLIGISVAGFTAVSNALTGWMAELLPIGTLFLVIGLAAAGIGVAAAFYRPLREL